MSEDVGAFAEIFGRLAYEFSLIQPMIPTYAHLIVSALFPIFAGAHASLSRPSSAAKPEKRSKQRAEDDDDTEDEEEEVQRMEGLSPSDALMFPLLAGCTLAGLYFLIKWLQDPAILNKLLNWYFAIFGVFSVSKLVKDFLDFVLCFVFPHRYARGGSLWQIHSHEKQARPVSVDGKTATVSPLPGILSQLPLPSGVREILWTVRETFRQKWITKLYIHKVTALRAKVGINTIVAAVVGIASVIYFNTVSKPWFLTNLMGFGFSYGALQIMSPTTFATGSLILSALFFYDIYFVFYTPMMVTVAKSLDIPIKLVFPRPPSPTDADALPSFAMLGLGDVVLPGIMIGLALRFDLYLFYLRKQTRGTQDSDSKDPSQIIKARYTSMSNRWGDNFWTHSWIGRPLTAEQKTLPQTTFPKPYFYASLSGYVIGMLATLIVMHVFEHAQPALLYLVPGVLISTWLTALIRGELSEMWNFSEAVEDEEDEAAKKGEIKEGDEKSKSQKAKQSNQSFFSSDKQSRTADLLGSKFSGSIREDHERFSDDGGDKRPKDKSRAVLSRDRSREIFSFSIEAPFKLSHPARVEDDADTTKTKKDQVVDKDTTVDGTGQPRDKRARHS